MPHLRLVGVKAGAFCLNTCWRQSGCFLLEFDNPCVGILLERFKFDEGDHKIETGVGCCGGMDAPLKTVGIKDGTAFSFFPNFGPLHVIAMQKRQDLTYPTTG